MVFRLIVWRSWYVQVQVWIHNHENKKTNDNYRSIKTTTTRQKQPHRGHRDTQWNTASLYQPHQSAVKQQDYLYALILHLFPHWIFLLQHVCMCLCFFRFRGEPHQDVHAWSAHYHVHPFRCGQLRRCSDRPSFRKTQAGMGVFFSAHRKHDRSKLRNYSSW